MMAGHATALEGAYRPRHPSRSRFVDMRGVRCHLREWGAAEGEPLVLLHGFRDTSATFQFLVDELRADRRVIAPDWRGHGLSAWTPGSYWQAELMSDLDAILRDVAPDGPVRLVGHSMGGNIASLYAGIRPERVSGLVLLDAMGELLSRDPVRIDEILLMVLDSQGTSTPEPTFASAAELLDRLRRHNRRLDPGRAAFLAAAFARPLPGGRIGWPYDPGFRRSFPNMHTTGDWTACWRRIAAPVLLLISGDPRPDAPTSHPEIVRERSAHFRRIDIRSVPGSGHNLHHDAPGVVASAIEDFFA